MSPAGAGDDGQSMMRLLQSNLLKLCQSGGTLQLLQWDG
jgi:hypothetical protein